MSCCFDRKNNDDPFVSGVIEYVEGTVIWQGRNEEVYLNFTLWRRGRRA